MNDAVSEEAEASIIARERLRVLMIGFYVRGGIMLFFGCFFLIYLAMFIGLSFIPESGWNQSPAMTASPHALASSTPVPHPSSQASPPPPIFFRLMAGVFGGVTLLIWAISAISAYAGRCIQKRRRKLFIYIMAGLNCLFIPYGTLLGVFAFIILGSPAAAREFELKTNY